MSKVYVYNRHGGPDAQELINRAIPEPGPGELGVKVRAAAVNPVDWKLRAGHLGQNQNLPTAMGREVAGIITTVGEGVEGFAVGDAILGPVAPGYGGFAEDTIVLATDAVAKPEEISFSDAATIPVAAVTAYDGTHQIELQAGQTLLILGIGGGVGLMAAQIGKVHEFTVVGTGSESKRDIVESTGATLVPYGDALLKRLREVAPTEWTSSSTSSAGTPYGKSPKWSPARQGSFPLQIPAPPQNSAEPRSNAPPKRWPRSPASSNTA